MSDDHAAIKKELRREFREVRRSISQADRALWNEQIQNAVLRLPEIQGAGVIFAYLSHTHEVDTRGIIGELLKAGKTILTPSPDIKVLAEEAIFRLEWMGNEPGILMPVKERELGVDSIDCVIVPGLVWNRNGFRVGFGGGYFDRLLETLSGGARSVGLAYECQLVDKLPLDGWDRAVDVLVTEQERL